MINSIWFLSVGSLLVMDDLLEPQRRDVAYMLPHCVCFSVAKIQ